MSDRVYGKTLNEFIAEAASSSPTPGGGNVSAVVGTHAAAMVCMVANLTIGKKAYAEFEEDAKKVVMNMEAIIERLKSLTNKDMEAFDQYMAVFRMPKETDEDKKARAEAMQTAAKNATNWCPWTSAAPAWRSWCRPTALSKYGNKMAISDVGVGAMVAEAAMRSCMLSVDINLPSIKDQAFVKDVLDERARLFTKAEELKMLAMARVKEKMG
jgi:formiminotetrahydrofolate cyclodeaminase